MWLGEFKNRSEVFQSLKCKCYFAFPNNFLISIFNENRIGLVSKLHFQSNQTLMNITMKMFSKFNTNYFFTNKG